MSEARKDDTATRKTSSRDLVRAANRITIAVTILVVVGFGIFTAFYIRLNNTQKTQREASIGSCHRGNIKTITNNKNNYADFKLFSLLISASMAASPAKTAEGRQQAQEFISLMEASALSKTWTPLANCIEATEHPLSYIGPVAQNFSPNHPPPASAFQIGPNE